MTDRQRLSEQCDDELEREVLGSWQSDRLDPAVAERIAVALGVVGASTLATGGTLAAAEATHQVGVGAVHLMVLKWLAGGALCGLGVLSGAEGLRMALAPHAAVETAASVTSAATASVSRPAGLVQALPEAADQQPAPVSRVVPSTAQASHPRSVPRMGRTLSDRAAPSQSKVVDQMEPGPASVARMFTVPSSIAWETAALSRARAAVRRGDAASALVEVRLVRGRDNSGTFAAEFDRIGAWAARELRGSTRKTSSGPTTGRR